MAIGLSRGAGHRRFDEPGRQMLGGLGATRLFYAPPRGSVDADDPVTFQKRHREITGKGAGLPVWGIVRKLREIDALMTPALQSRVYEFHPELAWQYLAGQPLRSKHQRVGIEQPLALLRPHVPRLDEITLSREGLRREDAALDDLLDALVGLNAAQRIADGPVLSRRIPACEPQQDERGLRMEIWF